MNIDYLLKLAAKSLRIAGQPVVIDRPKGYVKVFPTEKGPVTETYPLDYGYFKGLINPQDKEEADVFIGSGGKLHGRYMKGKIEDGKWSPDEYKWYTGLTKEEYDAMHSLFKADKKRRILRNYKTFPSAEHLVTDIKSLSEKRAYWLGFIKAALTA